MAWQHRQRNLTVAAKAASMIDDNYVETLRVPQIARQLGCHESTLRPGFGAGNTKVRRTANSRHDD